MDIKQYSQKDLEGTHKLQTEYTYPALQIQTMSYCKLCRGPDLDTGGTEVYKWPCPLPDGAAHCGDDCRSIIILIL